MTETPKKRGVLGGLEPDPDKGKPFRHTRSKARLMLEGLDPARAREALRLLIDKHPGDVLDALIEVSPELEREQS